MFIAASDGDGGRQRGPRRSRSLSLSPRSEVLRAQASEGAAFIPSKASLPPTASAAATNYVVSPFSKSPRIARPLLGVHAPAANPLRDFPRNAAMDS